MRVVIPSVNYADTLSVTLPAWRVLLPDARIIVVTSPSDLDTQAVAREHGAGIVVTDAWYREGAVFDKARALDEAFGFVPGGRRPARGEACLSIDADVYPFGSLPVRLIPRMIYGCPRYLCSSMAELAEHKAGATARSQLSLMLTRYTRPSGGPELVQGASDRLVDTCAGACLGYFQLFAHQGHESFGSYPTAALYDLKFRDQFRRRGVAPGFYVMHLGNSCRSNWTGRTVPAWTAAT